MKSQASSRRGTDSGLPCYNGTPCLHIKNRKSGSALVAALSLAFLIFAITTLSLAHVSSSFTQISMRHNQAKALFLAEAGIKKAGQQLLENKNYAGESGTRLATGSFDVIVAPNNGGYIVTSTGHADSPLKNGCRKRVRATIKILNTESFRIANWREDP